MIKTSATLYATLMARQKRGGREITKKDEGVQSLALLPLFLIKRQVLFIILWAGLYLKPSLLPNTHVSTHASKVESGFQILTSTRRYTCIRAQRPVDYWCSHAAISSDICSFDMYLMLERFRSQILQALQWAKVHSRKLSAWAELWRINQNGDGQLTLILIWIWGNMFSCLPSIISINLDENSFCV